MAALLPVFSFSAHASMHREDKDRAYIKGKRSILGEKRKRMRERMEDKEGRERWGRREKGRQGRERHEGHKQTLSLGHFPGLTTEYRDSIH